MARTRVLVTLTDLHGGGAQRVMLLLLRELERSAFEPHLAVVRNDGPLREELPADVPLHDLGARRVAAAAAPLVALARRLHPDVLLSTIFHMNQLALLARPLLPRGTRIVIREAITPSLSFANSPRGRLSGLLLRLLYPTADRVVCQCRFMADDLARHFGVPPARITTIYNPIDRTRIAARAKSGGSPFAGSGPGPHVVAIGRLHYQKGFDELLRAFRGLLALEPDARLWILGEDPDAERRTRKDLEALAAQLGVAERVRLPGFVDNPYRYLEHADLFVLSSRYEGLPNVLLEALSLGCPVLALDRPGGTREIMELAGQQDRLVPELVWKREWLRGRGPEREPDLSDFSLDGALAAYARLLSEKR